MIMLDITETNMKDKQILDEINRPQLVDQITCLALIIGIVIGIVIGSGLHDFLFHAVK